MACPKVRRPKIPREITADMADIYLGFRKKYGMTRRDALYAAGYSRKNHNAPAMLDAVLAMSIDKQRAAAVKNTGYTIEYALKTLVDCSTKKENAGDRIRAIHEANSMLPGYLAPERKEIKTQGVFLELQALTSSDLSEMIDILNDAGQ